MATERIDIVITERGSRVVKRNLEEVGGTARTAHAGVDLLKRTLLTLGVGFTLNQAIGTLANFAQEMASVRAITGATETQFQMLREETKRLGAETRFSASQAAEGAQFLARAGFDTNQIMASLEQTLTLAQAGALDLGRAADIASNVLTGFRISADEAGRAVDVLAFAANRGNTDVAQLGEAMKFVAPVASGLGVALEEATAAVTALSDAGLQGSLAGTGLRRVLSTLEAPTDKVRRTLRALGVSAEEVQVSQVGLTNALIRLRDAGVDTGLALEIFGDRGGPAFEVLSQAIPRVQELNAELQESEGFAAEVAAVMDDNLNGALLSTRSAVEALVIAFGDLGAESLLTQTFRALATGIRFVANNLDDLAAATMAYAPLAVWVFRGQVVAAVMAARNAVVALTVAIAANPIGALAVAVSTAVAALVFFRNEIRLGTDRLATLGDLGTAVWEQLREGITSVTAWFGDNFSFIGEFAGQVFGDVELSIEGVLRYAVRFVDQLIGLHVAAFNSIRAVFEFLPDAFRDIFARALNGAIALVERGLNRIVGMVDTVLEFVGMEGIGDIAVGRLENQAQQGAKALGDAVRAGFEEGMNFSALENALDGVLGRAEELARIRARERLEAQADTSGATRPEPEGPVTPATLAAGGSGGTELRDELDQLRSSIDGVYAAQQRYAEALRIVNAAESAGLITAREKSQVMEVLEEQLRDQLDPLAAINRELDRERELMGLTSDAREIENQMRSIQQDLLRQGIILNAEELRQLREKLELVQAEAAATERRAQALQAILGPQEAFIDQLATLNGLVEEGLVTREQALAQLLRSEQNLLEGTIEGQALMIARYEETYARIDELRQADLISEQTAAQMKAKLDADLYAHRMSHAREFFGNLTTLSRSENRTLAAIGQAAAVTQATIDGVLAVQKALASAPPPVNYALAASVGVATAANVAQIMAQTPGFAFGGEFTVGGAGGTDSQMVAFRATPGERVSISTPQQDRDREREAQGGPGAGGEESGLRIINLVDPNLLEDYMSSPDGERVLVNTLRRNAGALRGVLGG